MRKIWEGRKEGRKQGSKTKKKLADMCNTVIIDKKWIKRSDEEELSNRAHNKSAASIILRPSQRKYTLMHRKHILSFLLWYGNVWSGSVPIPLWGLFLDQLTWVYVSFNQLPWWVKRLNVNVNSVTPLWPSLSHLQSAVLKLSAVLRDFF